MFQQSQIRLSSECSFAGQTGRPMMESFQNVSPVFVIHKPYEKPRLNRKYEYFI